MGRGGNDDLNIELALRAWEKFRLDYDVKLNDDVRILISSTEYGPAGHVYNVRSEEQAILRDADMSQVFSESWIRLVLFGLSQELSVTPLAMLQMQEKFITNLQFESQYGQNIIRPKITPKLQEVKDLLAILE